MLPVQFDDLRRKSAARPPEHRLMLAVIEDAVHLHQLGAGDVGDRRLFRETEEWFASEETASPFAFVTICEVFGLDPDWIRAGLRRWRACRAADAARGSRVTPFRTRRVSGSRHQVTFRPRASHRRT
jgi:hypothetical protein